MTLGSAPRVLVLSVGGTIAMSQDASGTRATPTGGGLTALTGTAGPDGDERIDGIAIAHETVADVGSPSVRIAHLAEVLRRARAAIFAGATGVVLTHGTDTLEESAFCLDRCWDLDAPLVLTGAMRPVNAPGADGPANVRDALRTAVAPAARGLGVLAVLDGQVHLAERVTKARSRGIGAFVSEPSGPVARVGRTDLDLAYRPVRRVPPTLTELPAALPRVPVLALGLGDDADVLGLLPAGAIDGLVVAGVGVGHVPAAAVPRLRALVEAGVPVVVATRIPRGGTARDEYDYPGSETDLLGSGCVMAGSLRPASARILLQLLLSTGADALAITAAFAAHGG